MSDIKAIDKGSVHRICSGQVVLSLSIGVKELVENSLDAGAKKVEIGCVDSGLTRIIVVDDGSGVKKENYEGLGLKHHTSKIREFDDVLGVETFGFRGEALSSLCALSKLRVITRTPDSDAGSELIFDSSGRLTSVKKVSRDPGTTVILEDLFYTLPVRREEFKKHLKREFSKMLGVLTGYALVSVGIKICCWNSLKEKRTTVLQSHGRNEVKETIRDLFGSKTLKKSLEVKVEQGLFKLEGYISSADHGEGRNAPDRQFLYLNSRPADLSKVRRVINEIYKTHNRYQYPFVYLNIFTNKDQVDVNVTPDKRQIFIENEKALLEYLRQTLNEIYGDAPSILSVSLNETKLTFDHSDETEVVERLKRSISSMKDSQEDYIVKKQKTMASFLSNSLNNSKADECSSPVKNGTLIKELVSDQGSPANDEATDIALIPSKNKSFSQNICTFSANTEDTKVLSFLEKHGLSQSSPKTIIGDRCTLKDVENDEKNSIGKINCSPILIPSKATVEEIVIPSVLSNDRDPSPGTSFRRSESPEVIVDDDDGPDKSSRTTVRVLFSFEIFRKSKKKSIETKEAYRKFFAKINPDENKDAEEELKKSVKKESFLDMQILGQFNLGFIVCLLQKDLFIIDQHATDEKYNFESLEKNARLTPQDMVIPQVLELTYANESLLQDNMDIFKDNGFEFDYNDDSPVGRRFKLKRVPTFRNWNFGKSDVEELIFMLADYERSTGKKLRPSRVRAMFASKACRTSIMIGTALSFRDMRRLVDHMSEMDHPWNCPHGRPTMRHLINLHLVK